LDFVKESQNANRTAEHIAQDSFLSDRVHIPKVYPEYTTKRVLTAEWIHGVRLSDRQGIHKLMGGSSTDLPSKSIAPLVPPVRTPDDISEPLEGGTQWVMQTMVDLFSAQIFRWGLAPLRPSPREHIYTSTPSTPTPPTARPDRPWAVCRALSRVSQTVRRAMERPSCGGSWYSAEDRHTVGYWSTGPLRQLCSSEAHQLRQKG
jgi:hypothetical protein